MKTPEKPYCSPWSGNYRKTDPDPTKGKGKKGVKWADWEKEQALLEGTSTPGSTRSTPSMATPSMATPKEELKTKPTNPFAKYITTPVADAVGGGVKAVTDAVTDAASNVAETVVGTVSSGSIPTPLASDSKEERELYTDDDGENIQADAKPDAKPGFMARVANIFTGGGGGAQPSAQPSAQRPAQRPELTPLPDPDSDSELDSEIEYGSESESDSDSDSDSEEEEMYQNPFAETANTGGGVQPSAQGPESMPLPDPDSDSELDSEIEYGSESESDSDSDSDSEEEEMYPSYGFAGMGTTESEQRPSIKSTNIKPEKGGLLKKLRKLRRERKEDEMIKKRLAVAPVPRDQEEGTQIENTGFAGMRTTESRRRQPIKSTNLKRGEEERLKKWEEKVKNAREGVKNSMRAVYAISQEQIDALDEDTNEQWENFIGEEVEEERQWLEYVAREREEAEEAERQREAAAAQAAAAAAEAQRLREAAVAAAQAAAAAEFLENTSRTAEAAKESERQIIESQAAAEEAQAAAVEAQEAQAAAEAAEAAAAADAEAAAADAEEAQADAEQRLQAAIEAYQTIMLRAVGEFRETALVGRERDRQKQAASSRDYSTRKIRKADWEYPVDRNSMEEMRDEVESQRKSIRAGDVTGLAAKFDKQVNRPEPYQVEEGSMGKVLDMPAEVIPPPPTQPVSPPYVLTFDDEMFGEILDEECTGHSNLYPLMEDLLSGVGWNRDDPEVPMGNSYEVKSSGRSGTVIKEIEEKLGLGNFLHRRDYEGSTVKIFKYGDNDIVVSTHKTKQQEICQLRLQMLAHWIMGVEGVGPKVKSTGVVKLNIGRHPSVIGFIQIEKLKDAVKWGDVDYDDDKYCGDTALLQLVDAYKTLAAFGLQTNNIDIGKIAYVNGGFVITEFGNVTLGSVTEATISAAKTIVELARAISFEGRYKKRGWRCGDVSVMIRQAINMCLIGTSDESEAGVTPEEIKFAKDVLTKSIFNRMKEFKMHDENRDEINGVIANILRDWNESLYAELAEKYPYNPEITRL